MTTSIGNKKIMAKNLKYYIEKSGKDRKELALAWDIPYSTISEWLNAKKYPRIDRIETMATYFGIPKSALIEEKLTDEKKEDNEYLAEIIVLMRMDEGFRDMVGSLSRLSPDKRELVRQFLQALQQ